MLNNPEHLPDEDGQNGTSIDDVVSEIGTNVLLRDSFEKSPNGTLLLDGEGRIKYFNPQLARYFDFSDSETASKELTGKVLFKSTNFCDVDEQKFTLLEGVLSGEITEARSSQVEVVREDDRFFYNIHIQSYLDGVRVDMVDVTDEMTNAIIDSLTNVFNRAYLDRILMPDLERKLEAYRNKFGKGYDVGVVYIDLKEFKIINDKKGHKVGDEMLKDVANLLKENVKLKDNVVRLGGDEFIIICEGMSQKESEVLRDRLLEAQSIYNSKIKDPILRMKMDIGAISGQGQYRDLIKVAETFMYGNKRNPA